MSTRDRTAVIVGAGFGGLAAALALRRIGIDAHVYERADDFKKIQVGGGVHFWPNGLHAFRTFDMVEPVIDLGVEVEVTEHLTHKGKVLARWPVGDMSRAIGLPTVGVSRADVLGALRDALPAEALHLGFKASGYEQDPDGVTVRFANGEERRGDMLIGADGARSAVRAQMHGNTPPRYAGYVVWQGNTHFEHPKAPIDAFPLMWGPGTRFLHFGARKDKRLYWAAFDNAPEGEKDPEGQSKKVLLERFRGWPAPVEEIIDHTDDRLITRMDITDRDPVDVWGTGRVTMVGDAAHAMTFNLGQGGNQAIEDAAVLMRVLEEEPDVPTALREYERRRMARTSEITLLARRIGDFGRWSNPVKVKLRETVMKLTFQRAILRNQEALMAYKV